ncbi:hypothetical protein [Actinoplanes sp. NPDC026619]|uniref:hypothetical protein n=1 Tax=Actinoplanes sp. NPDC026619 TaxID=3155798 RepID=UPI003403641D
MTWRDARAEAALEALRSAARRADDTQIAGELAVFEALAGFDELVRDLLIDPDAETRSMAALPLGWISTETTADRALLRLLGTDERDERARACLAEAALRLAGPQVNAEAPALLADPSAAVHHRVAAFVGRQLRTPDQMPGRCEVDPELAAQACAIAGQPERWPAEQIF